MNRGWMVAALGASVLIAGGCGIGYDRLALGTHTTVGVNVETTPQPRAEVAVSRQETVISPVFPLADAAVSDKAKIDFTDENTPAVLAGISVKSGTQFYEPAIGSVFATGDAAVTLGMLAGEADMSPLGDRDPRLGDKDWDEAFSSDIEGWFGDEWYPSGMEPRWARRMDRPRPLLFGTDTATGLKVTWTGTTGYVPDSLSFGYKRKELVFAPLSRRLIRERCACEGGEESTCTRCKTNTPTERSNQNGSSPPPGEQPPEAKQVRSTRAGSSPAAGGAAHDVDPSKPVPRVISEKRNEGEQGLYAIETPSVLASVEVDVGSDEAKGDKGLEQVQFFATGKAARALALRQQVRRSVFEQIDPEGAKQLFGGPPTATAEVIQRWIQKDPEPPERVTQLRAWLAENTEGVTIEELVGSDSAATEDLRVTVIRDPDLSVVPPPVEFSRVVSDLRAELTVPGRSDARKQEIRSIVAEELGREPAGSVRPWPEIRDSGGATETEQGALQRALDRVRALQPEETEPS